MELKTVRIQNFRSVEDSGEFTLEHLTCLVGKNEAGKTAVLQALAGLNAHPATPFSYDVERDYPKRFLARYNERHNGKEAPVLTTVWEINDAEKALLTKEFGAAALVSNTVTLTRGYRQQTPQWSVCTSEDKQIEHLIASADFSDHEKAALAAPLTTAAFLAKLKPIAETNTKHKPLLDRVTAYPNSSVLSRTRQILAPGVPQFMYFSNYDRMNAAVHLPSLRDRLNDGTLLTNDELRGDRLFWEFLEYAGITVTDILEATTFESFNARLQGASNVLTEEILEYWRQNPDIEVRVSVAEGKSGDPAPFNSGAVGRARIYNMLHKSDTSFSERSAGFTWFFSFLIKFDRVKKDAKGKVFLLLDEPGLTLHGLAQADLLRYFAEKLSPHHQVVYSTHSPFMVPHDNLMASRIVQDLVKVDDRGRRTPTGTQVRDDVLNGDRDSVFPLQGALGYALTQTLFVGAHTILVEGPGDILYLKALSVELIRRGRIGLDPNWVLCPAGGIDKIHSFVSLFGGNKLDVISLSDFTKKDRTKLEVLKRSKVVKDGGVLTIADFVAQEEADVEDLFEPQLFSAILNGTYNLLGSQALNPSKLKEADEGTERQVKKAEAYFRILPQTIPEFDHFTPSAWLLANPAVLSGQSDDVVITLDRAETLFKALNALRKV